MTTPTSPTRRVSVGIGQLVASRDQTDVLVAYGLGSCVGVTAYDPVARVGALVHILLPESNGSPAASKEPAWHADAGIDNLLSRLASLGASRSRLIIKLAGGGAVLGPSNASTFRIGERNAEAIMKRLEYHHLRPAATALGGTKGRTIEFHLCDGKTYVRTASSPASEL